MNWSRIAIITVVLLVALFMLNSWDRDRIAERENENRYGRTAINAAVQDALNVSRMNDRELIRECLRTRCLGDE